MKQRLWAFWKYDKFPYMLGAEIEEFVTNSESEGFIRAKGYPYLFKPIIIYPLEIGKKIQAKLEKLKLNRASDLRSVEDKYKIELTKILSK